MKKILPYLFLINCFFSFSQLPVFQWGFPYGAYCTSTVTDSANNIYATGSFAETVDFDPGPALQEITSQGQSDIFISKYTPNGSLLWVKVIGGVDFDKGEKIKIFNNELVIGGVFNLTVDFEPSINTVNISSSGSKDIFILKLTLNGAFIDAKRAGGIGVDDLRDINLDYNGNLLITGQYSGLADFDPSPANFDLTSFGYGIYMVKWTNDLNFIWAKSIVGSGTYNGFSNVGNSIMADSNGNVHVAGDFAQNADFNPGIGSFTMTAQQFPPYYLSNSFYLKLDENGNFLNAHQILTSGANMIIDPNDNLYFSGNFVTNSTDFDPGSGVFTLPINLNFQAQGFLRKMSVDGLFHWAVNLGANNGDYKLLALDASNNIYISSSFEGTVDLDPTLGIANYTSITQSNAFITKLSPNSEYEWSVVYGNITPGVTSNTFVQSIHVDSQYGIISSGSWGANGSTIDLDPGLGLAAYPISTYSNRYLSKLEQCQSTNSTFDTIVCDEYVAPDGAIYSTSGPYSATIPNASGCDSIITINLTINTNTTNTISPIVCESYTAPDNQVYTQSGQYFATLPNSTGCDSIISINLIVNTVSTSTISPIACKSYTAPDNQVYTQSGQYFATIPNASGCDSLITINLTVNNVNTSIILNEITLIAVASGLLYEWIDCNNNSIISGENTQSFVATSNGNYAVIVTDGNCVDTSDCLQIDKVSIDELCDLTILISPNPATSVINIKSSLVLIGSKYIIYDQLGKESIKGIITSENTEIDLSTLTEGMYLFKVGSEMKETFSIIKQ